MSIQTQTIGVDLRPALTNLNSTTIHKSILSHLRHSLINSFLSWVGLIVLMLKPHRNNP